MLALSRLRTTQAHLDEAAASMPPAAAWPALVDAMAWHGVAPLVWRNMPPALRAEVPPPERVRLDAQRRGAVAHYLRIEILGRRVFEALRRCGVRPIALKGIALAEPLYEQPGLRALGDIDLYVPPEQAAGAEAALAGAGAAPAPASRAARARDYERSFVLGGVTLDVHTGFAAHQRFRIDGKAFELRSREASIFGHEVAVLCDEDLLLHLCVHLGSHVFEAKLKWIVDIEVLTRSRAIDWAAFVERARVAGATASCWMALRAAKSLLGARVPDEVLRELRPSRLRRAVLETFASTSRPRMDGLPLPRRLRQAVLLPAASDDAWRMIGYGARYGWLKLLDWQLPQEGARAAGGDAPPRDLTPALVAAWRDLVARGQPFAFRERGSSMWPVIAPGDVLVVDPLMGPPQPGEIVARVAGDRLVTHRVIEVSRAGDALVTQGDHVGRPDPPARSQDVLGRVRLVRKRYFTLDLATPAGRHVAGAIRATALPRRLARRAARAAAWAARLPLRSPRPGGQSADDR